jgi:hypothetical protein
MTSTTNARGTFGEGPGRRVTTRRALLVVVSILCVACGGDATTDSSSPTTSIATDTTAGEGPSTTMASTTTIAPSTTSSLDSTTTTATVTSTTAAETGEAVDFGPAAGDELAVIGVSHDDVLNLRAGPGVQNEVLAELDPLATDVVARGNTWSIPGAFWIEVESDGVVGWVNLRYVAYLGDTFDSTADIIASAGETPSAETMLDLGEIVAESVADADSSEGRTDIVMSVAPTTGDLGEVTYDVTGFGDDSVFGVRLHVFGQPVSGGGFELKSVESTVFCARGVSGGVCV